jgi:hypothetical protein
LVELPEEIGSLQSLEILRCAPQSSFRACRVVCRVCVCGRLWCGLTRSICCPVFRGQCA